MLDIELALTTWAREAFDVTSATDTPADLAGSLPFVQVRQIGGTGTRFSGEPRVDVDVYAGTYSDARDLAGRVHDALMMLRGEVNGAIIRDVSVAMMPSARPYDNTGLRRIGATYYVSARAA